MGKKEWFENEETTTNPYASLNRKYRFLVRALQVLIASEYVSRRDLELILLILGESGEEGGLHEEDESSHV